MEEWIDGEEMADGLTLWDSTPATPLLPWLVTVVAVCLCIWAIAKLARSRDPATARGVLRLLGRVAVVALLAGGVSFFMDLAQMFGKIGAMAGPVNTADLAAGLSSAFVLVTIPTGAATVLLLVRAALEYLCAGTRPPHPTIADAGQASRGKPRHARQPASDSASLSPSGERGLMP